MKVNLHVAAVYECMAMRWAVVDVVDLYFKPGQSLLPYRHDYDKFIIFLSSPPLL